MNLKIEDVASSRSFVFLWCGSYEGLDLGREVSHKIKQVYIEKKTSLYLLCDDYVLSIADGTSVSTFLCTPGA